MCESKQVEIMDGVPEEPGEYAVRERVTRPWKIACVYEFVGGMLKADGKDFSIPEPNFDMFEWKRLKTQEEL